MDGIKKRGIENLEKIRKDSEKILESSAEMRKEAEQVNSIVEGISLNDEETKEVLGRVTEAYGDSFESASEKDVKAPAEEVGDRITEQSGILEEELGNVRGGIGQLERAQGITEIGREGAEKGKKDLEKEAGEYSDTISGLEDVRETQDKEIAKDTAKMGSLFHMSR